MSDGSTNQGGPKEALSALADGELDGAAVQRLCVSWRDDASVRRTWHAYQLIGDALRSDDLAAKPAHDEAFLLALRARLAQEPVVLAPQPIAAKHAPARRRAAWAAPFAVAAGFMAVAGVLVVTRVALPLNPDAQPSSGASIAALQPDMRGAQPVAASEMNVDAASAGPADLRVIRDARLDRYLAAHKQFGNRAGLSVPGATLRDAAAVMPER